jgi:site-specific DNA recombinase
LLLHKNAKSDVKFMWNIHLSVAKKFTDNLREEAMKGWAEKLAQGWLPAPPPPGYMTITEAGKRIHVPNPDTKMLIQAVFKKYLEPSQSLATIVEQMRLMGIRTRGGRPYAKSNAQLMLINPFYIGINRFNGKDYPGAQEPIISKDIFEAVQRKMHKGRPAVYAKHNPIYKSLIRCEDCGCIVTWQLQKGRYYGVCKRLTEDCKQGKMLREDSIEELVAQMLGGLVCPSSSIIEWTAASMRERHKEDIEKRERLAASIQTQLDRIERMDSTLYDDKLAGDITQEKYKEKHEQLITQKDELTKQLAGIDQVSGRRLEQRLVLLELSQKAAQIYPNKTPEQKRLIVSKLFSQLTVKGGSLSVKYTNFVNVIAEKVQITRNLMEAQK